LHSNIPPPVPENPMCRKMTPITKSPRHYTNGATVMILFFTPSPIFLSCGKFGGKIIAINP
jgi:hypothetical protein